MARKRTTTATPRMMLQVREDIGAALAPSASPAVLHGTSQGIERDDELARLRSLLAASERAREEAVTELDAVEEALEKEQRAHKETREALEDKEEEMRKAVADLEAQADTTDAQDALSDWLVANGYPANPIRVDDALVQAMVDAILP